MPNALGNSLCSCHKFNWLHGLFICLTLLAIFPKWSFGIYLNEDGLYEDVTVGISVELDESTCDSLVDEIKDIFNEANQLMATALPGLGFRNILVIVDSQWACPGYSTTGNQGMPPNLASIRVGPSHPVFGNEPWTQQPRGCGMEGDFVHFSEDWIYNGEERGKRLLHEWAKFRWGVFEEYGLNGDPIFPPSIQSGENEFLPNYCTNTNLDGTYTSQCTNEEDCIFEVDMDGNSDVISSLMAVPYLDSVEEFCSSSTHVANASTKHNLLCGEKSVKEIIELHPDSEAISQSAGTAASVGVTMVYSSSYPSLVIAYETTAVMSEATNRFEFEVESLAQFISYEIPLQSNIGLVSFDQSAVIQSYITPIESRADRIALADIILGTEKSNDEDGDLKEALEAASTLFRDSKGVIIMLTSCTDKYPGDADDLVEASMGNMVWLILYPTESTTYLSTYNDLAQRTGGRVFTIEDELYTTGTVPIALANARQELSQALRQLLHMNNDIDMQQIDNDICQKEEVNCQLMLKKNALYKDNEVLYIYFNPKNIASISIDSIDGGTCLQETESARTTMAATCTLNEDDATISIDVTSFEPYSPVYAELVGKMKDNSYGVEVSIWASNMLTSLSYSDTSAPSIFVQPYYENRIIVFANASAELLLDDETSAGVIQLNDDGIGADITGNDGIYSAYVLPVQEEGQIRFNFNIHDDKGNAKLYPQQYTTDNDAVICCGSTISLPDSLESMGTFSLSTSVSAYIIQSTTSNLPPGMIKDLQISEEDSSTMLLTFTAQGEDLDHGAADHYILTEFADIYDGGRETQLSDTPKQAGLREEISISLSSCSSTHYATIVSVDSQGQRSDPSNKASIYLNCGSGGSTSSDEGLSAGAIAGIVIGCLLFIILIIILIVYLCSRDKYGEKRIHKHSKVTSCSCCKKEKTNEVKSTRRPQPSAPRAIPIRSIHDLDVTPSNVITSRLEPYLDEDVVDKEGRLASGGAAINPRPLNSPNRGSKELVANVLGEGYPTDSFRYSANVANANSEASLHSVSTSSPMPTVRQFNKNLNEVGIPVLPQKASQDNLHRLFYQVSVENLNEERPRLPVRTVRQNTQV